MKFIPKFKRGVFFTSESAWCNVTLSSLFICVDVKMCISHSCGQAQLVHNEPTLF